MEDFASGIVLLGVPVVALVPLVVEGLKRLGMPVNWATLAAVIVSGLLATSVEPIERWPELSPFARFVLAAIILGFGSSGVYSRARHWQTSRAGEPTNHS